MARKKVAVVLFNLGGPDRVESVRPFLYNLFADAAIIRIPAVLRIPLALLLSRRRAKAAVPIYEQLGGGSPLLANTEAQARAIEAELAGEFDVRCFVAMRYWHPMSDEAALAVKDWGADRVVLLPLYPQFSTTTTGSSLRVWEIAAKAAELEAETSVVCCYPTEPGFLEASARLIREHHGRAAAHGRPRVLFSAHGLPKRVVEGGDPYQWQCERTAAALVEGLGIPDLDWALCYQSRVGPLEWIGPSTDQEIERAGRDKVPLVVVPMAFVSEHSETLVEIEVEYRHAAEGHGVPWFERVPTVGVEEAFVAGLARLVRQSVEMGCGTCSEKGGRLCPSGWRGCPQAA